MIIDDQEDIQFTIAATVEADGHEAISVSRSSRGGCPGDVLLAPTSSSSTS